MHRGLTSARCIQLPPERSKAREHGGTSIWYAAPSHRLSHATRFRRLSERSVIVYS